MYNAANANAIYVIVYHTEQYNKTIEAPIQQQHLTMRLI